MDLNDVERLMQLMSEHELVEIEINPLLVLPDRVCAVDALMRLGTPAGQPDSGRFRPD